MNASRAVLAMVLFLSGCSSCNRGEESGAGAGGAAARPAQPAAATAGKIQVAPPQAATGRSPNPAAPQGGSEAAPVAPQAAQPPGQGPASPDDCVVVADVNPDFGPPPLAAAFTAEADCGQGVTYKWDFGDGSPPSTEPNPTHTYTKDGDYTASVTVSGPNGATASDEIDIFVEED
ncbi:MAG TPA: PKD domain-containing protein [Candidatus Margulisiibacteriota bacterium]|nr:PKD domain-containing protein [Candidatus Margulisiibacteriota bacterium]